MTFGKTKFDTVQWARTVGVFCFPPNSERCPSSHSTLSTTHLRYTGNGRYSQQTENKQTMRHRNANIDRGILVQMFLCRHLTIRGTKQAALNQLIARWKAAIHHRRCSATAAAWLRTPDGW